METNTVPPEHLYRDTEAFRDSIATVDEKGKRVWIYPKKPSGRYYNARTFLSIILLTILFAGPFVRISGQPLLMLNVFERKFVVLGQLFLPQDFHIFVFMMILVIVFVVLFTVAFGRLFCGWICPQTIFLEMVFRKIEYLLEGDANAQRKLAAAPWTGKKIAIKTTKQIIFFSISFLIANTFLAYIVGSGRLMEMITQPPAANLSMFTGLVVFTSLFYGVFARFREQACIAVCPYGRIQGLLTTRDTVVISYDYVRGEPRGKIRKEQPKAAEPAPPQGDCIDCKLCVAVCPTGIDIRNGIQLECVSCTACIDACDEVMDKVSRPRGLIRYDSENGISQNQKFRVTPRLIGYSVVLTLLLAAIVYMLSTRNIVETTVLRARGQLYHELDNGVIRNLYTIQINNKSLETRQFSIRLMDDDKKGALTLIGNGQLRVEGGGKIDGAMFIDIPRDRLAKMKSDLEIGIFTEDGHLIETVGTTFVRPR